jgi:hypothetical protein
MKTVTCKGCNIGGLRPVQASLQRLWTYHAEGGLMGTGSATEGYTGIMKP